MLQQTAAHRHPYTSILTDMIKALIEADSLDVDIALATLKEIEIYCSQIHIDSMVVLESLYAYDTQEITHCQQYSIYLSHRLPHATSFITSFIFSVP